MTTTMKPVCANPLCDETIKIIPGHRTRKYCSDGCKQQAYLQREEAKRQEEEARQRQAQYELDMAELRERYALEVLPPETLDKLLQLRSQYGTRLVDEVGALLKEAVKEARRSYDYRNNQLRDEIMVTGEMLGFVAINGPHDRRVQGVEAYCDAVGTASQEDLYKMRDSVHLAWRARQRMRELSVIQEARQGNRHDGQS